MFSSTKRIYTELDRLLTAAVTLAQEQGSPERTIDTAEALLVQLDALTMQGGSRLKGHQQGITRTRAELCQLIGSAWMSRARIPEAKEAFLRALSLWRELCAYRELCILLNMCGALMQLAGDRDTAMSFYAGAIHAGNAAGGGEILYRPYHNLGQLFVALRQLDQAASALEAAVGLAEELKTQGKDPAEPSPYPIANDALVVATWYHGQKDRKAATWWFEKCAAAALIEQNPQVRAVSVLTLARYEVASGQMVFAEGRVAGLLRYCSDHGLTVELTRSIILLTEIRLRESREIGNMRLIRQQMESICRSPGSYPQDCYQIFRISADFCRRVLGDITAAQRYEKIYHELMRDQWKQP